MKTVTILGGGIIGLCTAYYLNKEGYNVTVIDKSALNEGASYVNAGYITPSHLISLASPGMLKKGLLSLLKKESPFYIKPRLDLTFFEWAYHFYQSTTKEKVQKAIPIIKEINLLSKSLYDQIRMSEDLGTFQLDKKGLLMLYKTQKEADREFEVVKIAKNEGLNVQILNQTELLQLEPTVNHEIQGGFLYKCDAHTTPNEFMPKMITYLKDNNVKIVSGEEVIDLEIKKNVVTKIVTHKNEYLSDEVVMATGSWTGSLGNKLKLKIPVQPGKGYSINSSRDLGINYPAVLMESKVAVTPMIGFTRFAGTMEFSGSNTIIRPERVKAISNAVSDYYTQINLIDSELKNAKCGLRPITPDGLPYIGYVSSLENLVVAAGHAMMGWSMGPATGKLVCELINKQKTSMDLRMFCPNRFT
ncbi:NAD(P)/FAD-dependent oxidoreductase [Ascidiimonas sp. W6]|uniref:NAD(P)/FAD-dependent oxidoreductase n=1 Tax=Ascidiimonas meishanensis TaxID=3128903 RepID=UPI0030ECABCD